MLARKGVYGDRCRYSSPPAQAVRAIPCLKVQTWGTLYLGEFASRDPGHQPGVLSHPSRKKRGLDGAHSVAGERSMKQYRGWATCLGRAFTGTDAVIRRHPPKRCVLSHV